jgi:ribosomal protein S18 acetylase RimI-like enzyme
MTCAPTTSQPAPQHHAWDVERLRTSYGKTALPWSRGGRYELLADHWIATSGCRNGPNQALVHAESGAVLGEVMAQIQADGLPTVLSVTGPALGEVQRLVDAGWVCIGARPFMGRLIDHFQDRDAASSRPYVTPLLIDSPEVDETRAVLADAFDVDLADAIALLPDAMTRNPDVQIWVVRDDQSALVGCAMTSRAEDVVAVWNVATHSSFRRSGHAEQALRAIHGHLADLGGVTTCLLSATASGYSLYRKQGYETLENWQMWSRPRWFFGRR